MEPISLNPRYSTKDIPGKCIKCLAEQKLNSYLRELLREETNNQECQKRYESLVSFLKSPESSKIRDEAERLLADGRRVTLKIHLNYDKHSYELKVD